MIQERERYVAKIVRHRFGESLDEARVFEAGCGGGYNLRQLVQWGFAPENLLGVDVDQARVAYARTHSAQIDIRHCSADQVAAPDSSYDFSLAFTLFSSVPDEETAAAIAEEMFRLTAPGGILLIYDMRRRNPYNDVIRPVGADDIRRWFPKCPMVSRSITLVPPLARFAGRRAPWLYGPLAKLPFLRSHAMYLLRKPMPAPRLIRAVDEMESEAG